MVLQLAAGFGHRSWYSLDTDKDPWSLREIGSRQPHWVFSLPLPLIGSHSCKLWGRIMSCARAARVIVIIGTRVQDSRLSLISEVGRTCIRYACLMTQYIHSFHKNKIIPRDAFDRVCPRSSRRSSSERLYASSCTYGCLFLVLHLH